MCIVIVVIVRQQSSIATEWSTDVVTTGLTMLTLNLTYCYLLVI